LKAFLAILFVSFFLPGISQPVSNWKHTKTFSLEGRRTVLDQLNNTYVIRKWEIVKLNYAGEELSRYSNKMIGEDIQLDVTNPLKVILYSPNQMRMFFLDSRLGEMSEQINWMQQGYEQISLVATSHTNGIWLYDPINFQLIRLFENLELDRKSLNLAQLVRLELYPTDVIEVNNKVFVFDVFANYLRKIPIKGIERLVISDNRLFYTKDNQLMVFNLLDSSEELVNIELNEVQFFSVNRNKICLTKSKGIFIYEAMQ
jgi:hypothetical protein